MNLNDFKTTREASIELKISYQTVMSHIRRGSMMSVFNERTRGHFVHNSEIERFKRERKPRGRPKKPDV